MTVHSVNKKLLSFVIPQTIERTYSKHNGEITVRLSAGRISIDAGGLMQSGKFLEDTWQRAFESSKFQSAGWRTNDKQIPIRRLADKTQNILVLGLGAGSIAHVLNKKFPGAKITGVDIDPVMVDLGKKYLQLARVNQLTIVIADAQTFVTNEAKKSSKYDLIFVDLYTGMRIPQQFQATAFFEKINRLLATDGTAVFNLLAVQMKNLEAKQLLDKLRKIFHDVDTVSVFANCLLAAHRSNW